MRDKNLIYTDLPDGKIKVIPKNGYRLYCTLTKAYMSEAITVEKDFRYFVGVK